MDLSVVIPNRFDARTHHTVRRIDETCVDRPEVVVVQDGCGIDRSLPEWVVQIEAESYGTSFARHVGIVNASCNCVLTIDSHMEFLDSHDWANNALKELSSKRDQVICGRMGHLKVGAENIDDDTAFGRGASICIKTDNNGEHLALNGKWRKNDYGEISCIMGAIYGVRKDWYTNEMASPMSLGIGWGNDEETMSLVNWICGGETRLVDVKIGHIFNTGPHFQHTPLDTAKVWYNRERLIRMLPMGAPLKTELLNWIADCRGYRTNRAACSSIILEMEDKINFIRNHLSSFGRTVEDFLFYWYEKDLMSDVV